MASIKKILLCIFALFIFADLHAQQLMRSFQEDMSFVQYLQDKGQYQNAIIALNEIPVSTLNPSQQDSLNYLKGWSFYNIKSLDSSSFYLLKVDTPFTLYAKSRFFGAYNFIYLQYYDEAAKILNNLAGMNPTNEETKYFEQAGIALLKKNYPVFDTLSSNFSYNFYALSAQEKRFLNYKKQLQGIKKRSPVVAGLMSAIIPGTGKIYAGKTYQGIASMLPIVALALLTNESYHKRGPHSAEFYGFGALLTVFYVGNIWGSVFAVKINREDHEKSINQKILFDLQIPLRTIFN
jgi:tetratricopeptide (TPR) repeat protein